MIDVVALYLEGLPKAEPPRRCDRGHTVAGEAKFCPECGLPVPPAGEWRCPGGHLSDAAAKFCPECGAGRLQAPVAGAGVAVELAAQVQPARELTESERAERERLHAEAVRLGKSDPQLTYKAPSGRYPVKVIHFMADGLTAFGVVWMRGQELALDENPNDPRWVQAQTWINKDRWQQIEDYGEQKFAEGPWPGKRYVDGAGQFQRLRPIGSTKPDDPATVTGPTPEMLAEADRRERMRGRGVPQPSLR